MPRQQLNDMLQRLHRELEHADSVSGPQRELLREITDDIDRLLGEAEPGDEAHGLGERVTEAVGRFEQSHPNIAFALRRVVDALGRMGI